MLTFRSARRCGVVAGGRPASHAGSANAVWKTAPLPTSDRIDTGLRLRCSGTVSLSSARRLDSLRRVRSTRATEFVRSRRFAAESSLWEKGTGSHAASRPPPTPGTSFVDTGTRRRGGTWRPSRLRRVLRDRASLWAVAREAPLRAGTSARYPHFGRHTTAGFSHGANRQSSGGANTRH